MTKKMKEKMEVWSLEFAQEERQMSLWINTFKVRLKTFKDEETNFKLLLLLLLSPLKCLIKLKVKSQKQQTEKHIIKLASATLTDWEEKSFGRVI